MTMRLITRERFSVAQTFSILTALMIALVGLTIVPAHHTAGAQFLPLFAEPGSRWQVISGYNTFTHSVADGNDPYALDIAREDADTSGSIVYSPVTGTVRYADDHCVGLTDQSGVGILMCHLFPDAGARGRAISRGQRLGVVAPPGAAGNNGVSHIHIALTPPNSSAPMPFTGAYALEGVEMPATTEPAAYTGNRFTSTLRRAPIVDAGVDLTVAPRAGVTLGASVTNPEGGALTYTWTQTAGTSVVLTGASGLTGQFTAPLTATTLTFRFTVTELATGDQISDTVTIRVASSVSATATPTATSPASSTTTSSAGTVPRMVSGSVPATGFGLVVFSGGTTAQLVTASGCPAATVAFWTVSNGAFTIYVPGTTVTAVNADWNRIMGSSLPANTPLLARCR
jgi:hypothetical protein